MNNTWKYKIDLRDDQMFEKIEHRTQVHFPEELKSFIREHNAATPAYYNFMVGVSERVFGAVLSFNVEETDVDTVSTALKAIQTENLIPFGIDPFGNYICYRISDKNIVFWDHETGNCENTEQTLDQFIKSLY